MTTAEKRPDLLRLLFADPWRKLAAVVLAILLWHYLDNQITDTLEPTLVLQTGVSVEEEPATKDTLLVVVDRSRYFVDGYFDLLSGRRIGTVQLTLRGDRHLIKALVDEGRGFRVTPSLEGLNEPTETVEFTVEHVRAVAPKFQELIIAMTPAAVRIDLVENTRRDIPLNPHLIEISAPPDVATRLLKDSAEFSTKAVSLLGPADQIAALQSLSRVFVVEIGNVIPGDTEARGTLRLLNNPRIDRLRFADREPVTVTVPLRIPFQSYTAAVPYILDQAALPPDLRGRFRPAEESAEIEIEVSHNLELTLAPMNEADRRAWIWQWARLWVRLPPDATAQDVYTPQFIIVGDQYESGLDYRVVDLKPLWIERVP